LQKLTAVSGDSAYVAVGGTDNKVAVLSLPSLEIVIPPFVTEGGDVVDLSWGGPDGLWLAVTTAQKVDIYALVPREKLPGLEVLGSIPAPEDTTTLSFRAARFAPERTPTPAILAVLNSAPSRKDRRAPRKAYVAKFDAVEEVEAKEGDDKTEAAKEEGAKVATATAATRPNVEWTLATKREVARKPITVFDVSADGRLVAFGASDLCIGMMDAKTLAVGLISDCSLTCLQPLLKILQAHSFPPTALKFNPSGTLLASASADNTIRTVVVPASFGSGELQLRATLMHN
jgi:prolactin regulatory element-binding protein